ncbi:MAG: hypothetical protein ACFFFG_04815 [Candidatus Thorarchaeota archaeon]
MDQERLEHLYVTGEYVNLLEELEKPGYVDPSSTLTELEIAICLSYHIRTLIRLGKIDQAKTLVDKIPEIDFDDSFSISSLINLISIMNVQITDGHITEAITSGMTAKRAIKRKFQTFSDQSDVVCFWRSFLEYLLGMAHYYQINNDLAYKHFEKSLELNKTNLYIRGKALYYMAFIKQAMKDRTGYIKLLEASLGYFESIGAKQGMAWIFAWQGQQFLREGDLGSVNDKLTEAMELFVSISDVQGISLVNSLKGLMYYQLGELEMAEKVLEHAFDFCLSIGNPVVLSYSFLPLIQLYIESKNRSKAQNAILRFQEFARSSPNKIVQLNGSLAEAIFLKSSSRIIDRAKAQGIFFDLLNKENVPQSVSALATVDKDLSFIVVFHLIELYLDEFKIAEDKTVLHEAHRLIDDQFDSKAEQCFSPTLVEFSILKAKLLIIEGEFENALSILEQIEEEAKINQFHRLEDRIKLEINKINEDFQKWDSVIQSYSIKERIDKIRLEEYLKETQSLVQRYSSEF